MTPMKFLLALSAAALMVVSAISCGGSTEPPSPNPPPQPQPIPQTPATGETSAQTEAQAKIKESALMADLGQVYLKHQSFEGAATCFTQAIKLTEGISQNALHYVGLASAHRGLGQNEQAIASYRTAIEIYKKNLPRLKDEQKSTVYEQICLIYREIGERKEAISWAEKIAGDGEDPASVVKLARLYAYLGEQALAIDTYKMVIKRLEGKPEGLQVQLEFAEFLAKNENLKEARRLAEEVQAKADKNKNLKLAAKRLLLRVYDTLGILDEVDIDAPEEPGGDGGETQPNGERKGDEPGDGSEKKD